MPPSIFDNKAFRERIQFKHSAVASLQNLLTSSLEQRLRLFSKPFASAIWHEFRGCRIKNNSLVINPDIIPFKESCFDLICSAGPFMYTNDIPGTLSQWHRSLKADGMFFASFVGENSLIELKNCFFNMEEKFSLCHQLRFLPTIATKDAGMLMQRAGFNMPTADCNRHIFQIDTLMELLGILRAFGGNILLTSVRE